MDQTIVLGTNYSQIALQRNTCTCNVIAFNGIFTMNTIQILTQQFKKTNNYAAWCLETYTKSGLSISKSFSILSKNNNSRGPQESTVNENLKKKWKPCMMFIFYAKKIKLGPKFCNSWLSV